MRGHAFEDGGAGGGKRERKRFARDAAYKRAHQKTETGGDVACERDRLALDVGAAIFFFEAPIGVHAPEETAIVSFGQQAFI